MAGPARATVLAYLQVLAAVAFLVPPTVRSGSALLAVANVGIALCLFAFAASLVTTPDQVRRGAEPASRWLLAFAGVATLAALWLVVSLVI